MTAHLFTRAEMTLIDQYPRLSTTEIARALGVSSRAIYDWLTILEIPRTHVKHHHNHLMAKNDSRHCSVCGIILAAAARMDGHGWDGNCRYCACLKQGVYLYEPLPVPGGNAPELRVFESIGMACGRDDK